MLGVDSAHDFHGISETLRRRQPQKYPSPVVENLGRMEELPCSLDASELLEGKVCGEKDAEGGDFVEIRRTAEGLLLGSESAPLGAGKGCWRQPVVGYIGGNGILQVRKPWLLSFMFDLSNPPNR